MKRLYVILMLPLLWSCFSKQPVFKTGLEGKPLPEFTFLLQDSSIFDSRTIPEGKPFIIFYFSPGCPYCRAQMRDFKEPKPDLKAIIVYALATESLHDIKAFRNEFELGKAPNIKVGMDNSNFLDRYFHPGGVPYIAVYGKNKELKRVFPNKTNIDLIADAVKE